MNPQHLKLLSDWSDLYRHLITLAFTQHGPAQRGFAADDLNELSAADQLHAPSIRAEKELMLLVVGIDQADQRAELYTFAGVVGARAELAPIGHRPTGDFCRCKAVRQFKTGCCRSDFVGGCRRSPKPAVQCRRGRRSAPVDYQHFIHSFVVERPFEQGGRHRTTDPFACELAKPTLNRRSLLDSVLPPLVRCRSRA
jgi:hypothetical protein